ncbi:MAG TPA: DNA repair protein RecN [Quisquiliibacterium sp.]|nr:DNA repair protein RecN [Quisquiliibacterium sp.]HQP66359.1 DNA repair protein RecN [Quisquiliibacterium sp.]
MLLALRLRDFVIVDTLDVDFGPGFTVLSGETGAGKSILLDALQMATGARADSGFVREGAARADISAEFRSDPAIDAWLAERDLTGDPGVVLMRRVIEADGRSRALINGQPATATLLRELGERLLDIHGQHAAQSLLRADGQRELLDAVAGLAGLRGESAALYAAWRASSRALEDIERNARELLLERERLEWQASELAQLALGPDEWAHLDAEQRRLANAAALTEGAAGAAQALRESDDALAGRIGTLLQRIRPLAQIDARLAPALELLESAAIQLDEAASLLSDYADRVDLDPQRLHEVESRIAAIFAVARKFRLTPDALAPELQRLRERLDQLAAAGDVEALRSRVTADQARYDACAQRLSAERRTAARSLSEGVTALLGDLGMAGGRLEIALDAAEPGPNGIDRIEFRVAGHAGASPRALSKVASGGELSRIGLAISVLAAQANPVPTLIFDEADAGIGGAVADVVGALMRRLGESRQVLCVTHLPQVAAKAHQHLAVSKHRSGDTTVSRIRLLERSARVEEIARMLGGAEITTTTRKHARELLAQA